MPTSTMLSEYGPGASWAAPDRGAVAYSGLVLINKFGASSTVLHYGRQCVRHEKRTSILERVNK
jgi:hypothetical protein